MPSTRIEELHEIAAFLEAAAKLPKTYEIDAVSYTHLTLPTKA